MNHSLPHGDEPVACSQEAAQFICVSTELGGAQITLQYLEHKAALGSPPVEQRVGDRSLLIEARAAGHFVLRWESGWRVCLVQTTGTTHLPESQGECVIQKEATLRLSRGGVEVWIRPTTVARTLPRSPTKVGRGLAAYLAGVLALTLILGVVSESLPESPKTLKSERFSPEAYLVVRPQESVASTSSTQHMVERERQYTPKLQSKVDPVESEETENTGETREAAMSAAHKAGVLGANNFDFAGLTAAAEKFRYSAEDTDKLGDLRPSEVNEKTGAWGYGLRKIGPGSGDGKDWGSVKSKYKMASSKSRGDEYVKNALTRPHVASAPSQPSWLDQLSESGLSYDVVRGQLGLRRRRLVRCYDVETENAEARPSVVHVRFAISASGSVSGVSALSTSNDDTRSCIEEIVRSIEFPPRAEGKTIHLAKFPVPV